uniref:Uncharacterized protein n=1 Tax=Arundo donax TaxID=35708 RepID=A0A0A9ERV7_ARUDO
MIFENSIRSNARKANISRCKDTLWTPIIDLDEATRKSGMTDDGRSIAWIIWQTISNWYIPSAPATFAQYIAGTMAKPFSKT